jgi:uncharacterized sulfatase
MLTRRDLLRTPLAAPFLSLAQNRKTNVLVIAVDDLNNRLGCYGDPVVKSPNIDRLAARGVRFDRAYCNYPLCNPSRTSLLSGRRPETTRVFDNTTQPRTYLGDIQFLPEYFKAQGYFTARVGKIAHGAFEHFIRWDISENAAGRPPAAANAKEGGARKQERRAANEGGVPLSWTPTDRSDDQEPDGATARRIAKILEEHRSGPFFIGCGFHKPHLPWVAPRKYFDMYSLDRIKLPATPPDDRSDIPKLALTFNPRDAEMSDAERREAIRAYHAATSFMDAQVGVVLDTLDRLKLWDNTAVLLFGDHGWHLYDHLQLWRKMTVFEEAAHAPLIVHAPGRKQGASSARFVEFVDFYPTLVELAGLPQPSGLEGASFVRLLDNPQRAWKLAAYTMVMRGGRRFGKSVRTDRYRYTEWEEGREGVELYDHETDINEWTNLAGNPKVARPQAQLQQLLRSGQKGNVPPA